MTARIFYDKALSANGLPIPSEQVALDVTVGTGTVVPLISVNSQEKLEQYNFDPATYAQKSGTLTEGRVVTVGPGGVLETDEGLTRGKTGGVTRSLIAGDGTNAFAYMAANALDAGSSYFSLRKGGVQRAALVLDGSNYLHILCADSYGETYDYPISFPITPGGAVTLGGVGATKRNVVFTRNLYSGSTQRISDVGRADFSSLYVSALAGGGVRPTLADNAGMVYATDAATFRGTIGAMKRYLYNSISSGASVSGTTEQTIATLTFDSALLPNGGDKPVVLDFSALITNNHGASVPSYLYIKLAGNIVYTFALPNNGTNQSKRVNGKVYIGRVYSSYAFILIEGVSTDGAIFSSASPSITFSGNLDIVISGKSGNGLDEVTLYRYALTDS